jgi:hypothetical protein
VGENRSMRSFRKGQREDYMKKMRRTRHVASILSERNIFKFDKENLKM